MDERARNTDRTTWARLRRALGWSRDSYFLLSLFFATVATIIVVWWPLARDSLAYLDRSQPLWRQFDWLLLGIFAFMSVMIMIGADLKTDALIILVGLVGGLVIESWGTQTRLWDYYTGEQPPLWIIPAWPVASLSVDRIVRILQQLVPRAPERVFRAVYWLIMPLFFALMLAYVWPTLTMSLTVMALLLVALMIISPHDYRTDVLTFVGGVGLGYFLERWGTTRYCWTYYTRQTPPVFAVLAHGMAWLSFWRGRLLLQQVWERMAGRQRDAAPARRQVSERGEYGS